MSIQRAFPYVAGTYVPTERVKTKAPNKGYSNDRNPKHKTLLTEAQVLEARWLCEYGGWTTTQVSRHYDLSEHYTRSLMNYATRSKITPKRDSFPPSHQPLIGK